MEDLSHITTPETACIKCGYITDAVTATTGDMASPNDGDLSMCLMCGDITRFRITPEGMRKEPVNLKELPKDIQETVARFEVARASVVAKHLNKN